MKAETQSEPRNEDPQKRSIILPVWLWTAVDRDAKRCKRSATKQVEALLSLCYDPEANVEIYEDAVSDLRAISQKRRKVA